MSLSDPSANRPRSALWMWGFWLYIGAALVAFVLSYYTATPLDRILRGIAGALLLLGGAHQSRVVSYKRATRPPYSTFGPTSYLIQRQTGWSTMVFGAVLIASAIVGL